MALLLSASTCLGFQFVVSTDKSWLAATSEDADKKCKAEGYDGLAKLESQADFDYLSGIAKSKNTAVWTGANDRANEGAWVWGDGTPLTGKFDPALSGQKDAAWRSAHGTPLK